jgi:membrane protein required for colicin V production
MTQFDYIVLTVIFLSALLGWWRGLVYEILSLLSWVTAYFVAKSWALEFAPYMPDVLENSLLKQTSAFLIIFLSTLILCGIAAWALNKLIKSFGLDWRTDGVLGAFFGLIRGVMLVLLIILLASLTELPKAMFWRDALLSKPLQNIALQAKKLFPDDLAKRVIYE